MNFNSHELQQAFEKAKTVIESIPQTQDTISNEIKFILTLRLIFHQHKFRRVGY